MGDHVLLTYPFCGECPNCLRGSMTYCQQGFVLSFGEARLDGSSGWRRRDDGTRVNGHIFQQSSFASHTLAAANSAVILDRDLPFNLAPAFGCGVSTGAGSVLNVMDLRPDSRLAILGVGTVGLAALMMARHLGVKQIIAVDANPGRLETAFELGATHTVDASDREAPNAIARLTGRGADYIFDTTGHPGVIASALDSLAMTGTVVMAGAAPAGTRTSLDMNALLNGRAVRGTIQGDAVARTLVPHLIELYKRGRFPVDRLVSNYPFAEIRRAVTDMESGRVIKPILRMTDDEQGSA
jgi:aryl-alcohol dehydrogenase